MATKPKKTVKKQKFNKNDSFMYRMNHSKWLRRMLYLAIFLLMSFLFVNSGTKALLVTIMIASIPLFMGIGCAWLLNPFVKRMMAKGMGRRGAASIAFFGFLAIIIALGAIIIPIVIDQLSIFWNQLTGDASSTGSFMNRIAHHFNGRFGIPEETSDAIPFLQTKFDELSATIRDMATSQGLKMAPVIGSSILTAVMGLAISYYLLADYDGFIQRVEDTIPENQRDSHILMEEIHVTLHGWFKGWILDQLFVFTFTALILFTLGVEQWIVLALLMMGLNFIPFIGPIIGATLIVAVLAVTYVGDTTSQMFMIGPEISGMTVIIAGSIGAFMVQTIESIIVVPKVYGKTVNIHPVTTLIGLSVVGAVFSVYLTPLTIPTIAVGKTIYKHKLGKELPL